MYVNVSGVCARAYTHAGYVNACVCVCVCVCSQTGVWGVEVGTVHGHGEMVVRQCIATSTLKGSLS